MTVPTYVTGYEFTNKQGLKAKVIAYRGRKDIDVQFEDGSIVTGTTGSYIKKGLPLHPTYGKICVGDRFPTSEGDTVEVMEYVSTHKIRIKWLSDGAEAWKDSKTLKAGVLKHPTKGKFFVGDKVKTNRCGVVEVVEVNSATNIVVMFEDGVTKKCTAHSLKQGQVLHPNGTKIRIGEEYETTCGWKCRVVEYVNAFNVKVEWEDGTESRHAAKEVHEGSIKPLTYPSVAGVGYFGYGKWVPRNYTKLEEGQERVDEVLLAYWQRMINRCYDPKELERCSLYENVEVDERWHNFQNFADWAYKQCNVEKALTNKGKFDLEKDALCLGQPNKKYCPETTLFMPESINYFLCERQSGKLPRGVNIIKPKKAGYKTLYVARIHVEGERKYLGSFDTPEEAFKVYRKAKVAEAKRLAEKWKEDIDPRAYQALMGYGILPY